MSAGAASFAGACANNLLGMADSGSAFCGLRVGGCYGNNLRVSVRRRTMSFVADSGRFRRMYGVDAYKSTPGDRPLANSPSAKLLPLHPRTICRRKAWVSILAVF